MAFYDHLGTNENICLSSRKSRQNLLVSALFGCSIQIHTQDPGFREHFRSHFFYFLGSCAKRGNIRRAAGRTGLWLTDGITTVMAHHPAIFMVSQCYITMRTFHCFPAGAAGHKGCIAPSVNKQHSLFPFFQTVFQQFF